MARAHFADVLIGTSGTGSLSLLDGATVHVYDQGTTTPISQTIYAADSGGTTIANPLTSDANGKVEFWLDTPARVDLAASKTGFSPSIRTVDVEAAPSGGGSGVQVATVEISSAELLVLDTTPKVLVGAPSANHILHPLLVETWFHPGSTPYAGLPLANFWLAFRPVSGDSSVVDQQGGGQLLGADPVDPSLSSPDAQLAGFYPNMVGAASNFVDRALVVLLDQAITGGNGTLSITVAYLVV